MPKNERTLQMMKDYVELHRQGLSIAEIARRYHLSTRTIYTRLQEIADAAGVPRESLLDAPDKGKNHFGCTPKPVAPVDISKFHARCEHITTELTALQEEVSKSIEELETMGQLLNEEDYHE